MRPKTSFYEGETAEPVKEANEASVVFLGCIIVVILVHVAHEFLRLALSFLGEDLEVFIVEDLDLL